LQEVRFFFEIETTFFLLVFQVTLHFFVFFYELSIKYH
jgi:hypothetical protein